MTTKAQVARRWSTRATVLLALTLTAACGTKRGDASVNAEAVPPKGSGSPSTASTSATKPTRVVLFVGTSLTAGLGLNPDSAFPQLIQAKLDSARLPFEVVNAGQSGETSAGLLRRLDWLMGGSFDVVVVETGANDGLRGTPVATIERNVREIVRRIQAEHPTATILLAQMEAPPNLGTEYTAAFRSVFPTVARERGVAVLPFILNGVAGVPSLNQGDGIHPNQRGEHIVADNIWRGLEPVLRARM